jgi:hypothetical protein
MRSQTGVFLAGLPLNRVGRERHSVSWHETESQQVSIMSNIKAGGYCKEYNRTAEYFYELENENQNESN